MSHETSTSYDTRIRTARSRLAKQGCRLVKRHDAFTITDANGRVATDLDLDAAERWINEHPHAPSGRPDVSRMHDGQPSITRMDI
jgi:hypothetical protein